MGIECIFEKPPKDATAASLTGGQDANAGSDRIKMLEAQMSGMQTMISELVASIKANTNAMATPTQPQVQSQPPQHSPSASTASPHSSRASRPEQYQPPRHHQMPLQQQQHQQQHQQHAYSHPPHHRSSQHESLQRYPSDSMAAPILNGHPMPILRVRSAATAVSLVRLRVPAR